MRDIRLQMHGISDDPSWPTICQHEKIFKIALGVFAESHQVRDEQFLRILREISGPPL